MLLACGVVAALLYTVVGLIQMLTRDGLDIRHHALSLLSNGDLGWIQITNFLVTGLLVIAGAAGMRRVVRGSRGGTWGPLLIGFYGVGLIGPGFFSADPALGFPPGLPASAYDTISWHGIMHFISGGLGFLALIAACFVFARRYAALGQRAWAAYSVATGVLFFAAFFGIASGPKGAGVSVAFAVAVLLGWSPSPQKDSTVTRPNTTPQIKIGPLVLESSPRWIRVEVGDVTVADSKRVLLLWQEGKVLPVYFFPRDDVRTDLLRPSEHPLPEDYHELATYWTLELGGRVIENAAWTYSSVPLLAGEWLEEYVALRWRAMDAWYEEQERVLGHPRDPYHRVDTRESSRHVRVFLDGETIANSSRPRLVFETGHPTRYYLTPEDVRMELLTPSETRTLCAYKGEASYWSANLGDKVYDDVAWSYPEPLPDNPQLRGLVCFFNERADIYVDDERIERQTTQWS